MIGWKNNSVSQAKRPFIRPRARVEPPSRYKYVFISSRHRGQGRTDCQDDTMHSAIKDLLRQLKPDLLSSSFRSAYEYQRDERNACRPNDRHLLFRLACVFLRIWDLGFTAFGGPPVHFRIIHQRFVDSKGYAPWLNEQTVRRLEHVLKLQCLMQTLVP